MSRQWLLTFDASTPRCVAAVGWVEGAASTCLASATIAELPNQASSRLVGGLSDLLDRAGIAASELAAVGCGRGPGTFTGTRVALATAMGLCIGAQCPALPLSTLRIVAASHRGAGTVLALLDARRGEVYAGLFALGGEGGTRTVDPVGEERCIAPGDWLDAHGATAEPFVAIGPGVAPFVELWSARGVSTDAETHAPTEVGLWDATVAAWRAGEAVDAAELRAVYLRRSYAELGVNRPKRAFVRSPFV